MRARLTCARGGYGFRRGAWSNATRPSRGTESSGWPWSSRTAASSTSVRTPSRPAGSIWPTRTEYHGGGRLTKFGYFAVGSFRQALQAGSQCAGLAYPVSPYDFGTERAPSPEEVRALVVAMRRDVVPYRPAADRTRITKAFIRASVLAHTGARVGEVAMLEPEDLRLQERAVLMPTEKHQRNSGRMERAISRRRIPLNDYGIAALKLFVKYDLFDRLADRTRVPDETRVPWYEELYYQVVVAARRVKDPYTGASLYFTPHCFRHSFATALAPLIGGDAKTGAKILGHSPQTFMRYVRANDETARTAVEKMIEGLAPLGQPVAALPATSSLRVVAGGSGGGA